MSAHIINEFIEALEQEIKAIKSGKGGSVVKIFNGQFIREISGLYIYLFYLESFLAVLDDSPAEIEVDGMRYPAQVIMTQNMQVEISIERYLGNYIGDAKLHTNLWYLLELLKKKFIEKKGYSTEKNNFEIADNVFNGRFPPKSLIDKNTIKYSNDLGTLNQSQEQAIISSFCSPISIIWGPPGTGKTTTIAKAVEAHIRAGRRVLLVSHANNAVDEALLDVAEQMCSTSFYNEGKLIRLGIPPDKSLLEKLSNNYPLVLIENIAAKLGATLSKEKRALQDKMIAIHSFIDQIQAVFRILSESIGFRNEADTLENSIIERLSELRSLKTERDDLLIFSRDKTHKLSEARSYGKIKRFFTGFDPDKIQRELDKASLSIDSKERQVKEIESLLNKQQAIKEDIRKKAHQTKMEYQKLLGQLGFTDNQLKVKNEELSKEMDIVQSRIGEIDKLLSEIQAKILKEAQFVATTLTKTFSSKEFPVNLFDVLILDEASMAPLPHFYWALGHCSTIVTIVGDFLQLPPICISEGEMARKWLGQSIFDILNINRVNETIKDTRVNLLNTQYRMHPEISQIPNRLFYEHIIKDGQNVKKVTEFDGISEKPLVLVDTSSVNPWCNRLSVGSRFNLYHALLCISIAEKIHKENPGESIGIITPYAPQARLINKIARDKSMLNCLRISTVHKFQGGEISTIIFDTVEALGTTIAPMLSESKKDSDARLVLNVAFTRAKDRIYLIAHVNRLLAGLRSNSSLGKIVDHFLKNADIINSENHLDCYLASDFEKWAEDILESGGQSAFSSSKEFHTQKNFYACFFQDIKEAKKRIIIVSPFLSIRRSGPFMDYFRAIIARGIDIEVFTKPIMEQSSELAEQANIVIEQLKAIGVKVEERYKIHNKTAIIDNKILWDGSLNILSHRDTGEHMWRFEGQSAIEEVLKNLELEDRQAAGASSDQICPICGHPMIYRKSRFGTFLSCSQYPKCKGKATIERPQRGRKR